MRLWRAPAKVNLTLHILGRREDGYHELDSIVAFAGVGDRLGFVAGEPLALEVAGPTATAAGPDDDNLVLRAARALARARAGLEARTLRAATNNCRWRQASAAAPPTRRRRCGRSPPPTASRPTIARVVAGGAGDGRRRAVCLAPRARRMGGIGEVLSPPLNLAPLPAVLVNPARRLADAGGVRGARPRARPIRRARAAFAAPLDGDVIAALAQGRNDMQASAEQLTPAITETLAALAEAGGARLARMSGSGATCFALYADRHAAARAAARLRRMRPRWWVRATLLTLNAGYFPAAPSSASTAGRMRATITFTPSAFGCRPSGWLSLASAATPSRKNG